MTIASPSRVDTLVSVCASLLLLSTLGCGSADKKQFSTAGSPGSGVAGSAGGQPSGRGGSAGTGNTTQAGGRGDGGASGGAENSSGANGASSNSGGSVARGGSDAAGGDAAGGDAAGGDAAGGDTSVGGPDNCWELQRVTRARLYPAPNGAQALLGGKIVGSNESPTAGFVDLASITTTPTEAQWTELTITNTNTFRYVKYYGPAGSYAALAELELYTGNARLAGAPFGSAGSRNGSGNGFDRALDGSVATYYEGALANDQYAGLDLASGHVSAPPTFSVAAGAFDVAQNVTLASTTPSATILYTTNGTDPRQTGLVYSSPIRVDSGVTTIRAVSRTDCMLDSSVAQASYTIGNTGGPTAQASIHLGNSLTDTIDGHLAQVALSGGVTLDLHKYTIPGGGTQALWEMPRGGLGEDDVTVSLRTTRYDHLTVQPYPNLPCFPSGTGSDADFVNRFYGLAKQGNPSVTLWVYQQWPKPAGTEWRDCITTGASWTPVPWMPPSQPTDWETATMNGLWYQERVREAVMALNPAGRPIYVIPGGLALLNLKRAVEAGQVPGIATNAFLSRFYLDNGNDDHLTEPGRWFISLVFYACLFQRNPQGVSPAGTGLTAEQATRLAEIAWTTVTSYQFSGVDR